MTRPAFTGAFGDNIAGMALACGLITALFVRERTGKGQEVYICLFQTGVFQLSFDISGALVSGQDYEDWRKNPPEELVARAEAAIAPLRDFNRQGLPNALAMPYKTKGGREIFLAMGRSDRYWSRFCQVIEREDLEHDPRFESFQARGKNVTTLMHILDEVFLNKTLDEWKPRLAEVGMCFGYDQNYREIIADPQARTNDFFTSIDHPSYGQIEVLANPINLSDTPATIRMSAPEFGQHTEEVLLKYGYTWEDIKQFKEQGIIA
jgi:crotonobetainyl-CoA:carnitine CoA-transferase CaiB-like acyl-CoA transferase